LKDVLTRKEIKYIGGDVSNQIVITFDRNDQAERYFKRFSGISGANKIEHGNKELETAKKQLNDSMNFHCPNFTTTVNGYVACDLDKHKILMELETTKKLLSEAVGVIRAVDSADVSTMDNLRSAREFLAKLSKEGGE